MTSAARGDVTATLLRPIREPVLSVEAVLVFAAVFGAAFGEPTLVTNFTFTDIAIGLLLVFLVASVIADGGQVSRETRYLFLPLSMIFLGSLVASTFVGIQGWVVRDLIRDLGAFAALFATANALRRLPVRGLRLVPYAVAASIVILTVQLVGGATPEARGAATFNNPNIPGHLLATAIGVLGYTTRGRFRVLVIGVGFVGLLATGSFGAALQLTTMVGYMVVSHRREVRAVFRTRPAIVFGTVLVLIVAITAFLTLGAASSAGRFDRSSSGRLDLWSDAIGLAVEHPLGVGPGTVAQLSLLNLGIEPHNEYLAYLAERGPLALAGLILFGVGLFRLGRRGGGVRMVVSGFAIASVFRETIHYRHIWLYLALLLVWEEASLLAESEAELEQEPESSQGSSR